MRISFTSAELVWLHRIINSLAVAAYHRGEDKVARIACKMKYKFTPNAHVSYLTSKERSVIRGLAAYRESRFTDMELLGDEPELVRGILAKVGGGPKRPEEETSSDFS
jgi:hypothetical protein